MTSEQRIRMIIGNMVINTAVLETQVEDLQREVEELKSRKPDTDDAKTA